MRLDLLTANDRPGQYPASWYAATALAPGPFAQLEGSMRADVAIVGGGFTGLSAALHMAEAGLDVVLLEASRVGFGASGRNGGQVHPGQRLDQDALERMAGPARARELWLVACEAVALTRSLAGRHAPDAHFTQGLIEACYKPGEVAHAHAYARKLAKDYRYDRIRPLEREELAEMVASPHYLGGTLDMEGGHLHPLRYAFGLARAARAADARIFERSRVTRLVEGAKVRLETGSGIVEADHVLIAANAYLGDIFPRAASRVLPLNNYIVTTEPLGEEGARALIRDNAAVADSLYVLNYYRLTEDHRLLFGGGESYGYRFPRDIAAKVRKPMLRVFPQLEGVKIEHAWGGTLGITLNRMPYFARLAPNVITMGGFSGHGIALTTMAGKLAAEAMAGQAGQFDLMASVPTPAFPGGRWLRSPLAIAGMLYYALRDRF